MRHAMTSETVHVRHCMLFLFDQGLTAGQAHQKLKEVYGANRTIGKTQINSWFRKFRTGDRSLFRLKRSKPTDVKIPPPPEQSDEEEEEVVPVEAAPVVTVKQEPVAARSNDSVEVVKQEVKEEEDDDVIVL
ncbi:Histone-lysine N-methyltransferase SETMAR-like [Aphelenchoides fujianensis]|nr:Histone-lysine N-methyltransferase SETMAR-like [Aphelenchoides fujianensis]